MSGFPRDLAVPEPWELFVDPLARAPPTDRPWTHSHRRPRRPCLPVGDAGRTQPHRRARPCRGAAVGSVVGSLPRTPPCPPELRFVPVELAGEAHLARRRTPRCCIAVSVFLVEVREVDLTRRRRPGVRSGRALILGLDRVRIPAFWPATRPVRHVTGVTASQKRKPHSLPGSAWPAGDRGVFGGCNGECCGARWPVLVGRVGACGGRSRRSRVGRRWPLAPARAGGSGPAIFPSWSSFGSEFLASTIQ